MDTNEQNPEPEPLMVCSVQFFSEMAARLDVETRWWGWQPPRFVALPADAEHQRVLRRNDNGTSHVAVRLDRPAGQVAADMIAGVIAVNNTTVPAHRISIEDVETELWAAALGFSDPPGL